MAKTLDELIRKSLENPDFAHEYNSLNIQSQLAEQIIRLRQKSGITQSQLAERIGTKQSSISRLENMGTLPSLSFLQQIAEELGAKVEIRLVQKD